MRKRLEKTNRSGIELAPPALTAQRPPRAEELAFHAVLVLLGVCGASWSFFSAFELPLLPGTLALYALLVTALFFAVFHFARHRGLFLLVLLCLLSTAGYFLRAAVVQGFLITTNSVMTAYANHSNFVFPIYNVAVGSSAYALNCTVFALFVLAFLAMAVCWAVIRIQSAAVLIAVTLPFPLSALVFNITPAFPALIMLLTGWTSLILVRMIGGNRQIILKRRRAYRAKNPAAASKGGLHLMPALILCFLLLLAAFPMQNYRYSGKAMEIRNRIMNTSFDFSLLDSGTTLAGSSDHVSLRGADSIRFTGKTMLRVGPIDSDSSYHFTGYLKGFTGAAYTGTSWEPLSDSDFAQVGGKLNGISVMNFSDDLLSLVNFGKELPYSSFGIRVKNVGANKKCIYMPYNLTTKPNQISGVSYIRDEVIRSGWLFGTGEYSLYANRLASKEGFSDVSAPELLAGLYGHVQASGDEERREMQKKIQQYLLTSGAFSGSSTGLVNDFAFSSASLRAYYTTVLPESLTDFLDDDAKKYLTAEQNYRQFLYEKYTALPSDVKSKMTVLLKEAGLTGNNSYRSTNDIVSAVAGFIQSRCSYSLTPGKVPAGKDFTEYFLTENNRGYCVHFATAATVLLRAMGIPARYAEGYIVTADDYGNSTDGWATVKDLHAHAWVEIYKVGFGWQPFEVTPGFSLNGDSGQGRTSENQTSSSEPESSASSAPASSASASSAPASGGATASSPTDTGRTEDAARALTPLLILFGCAALLSASLAARRRIALSRRESRFTQPNRNKAAIAVYSYLHRMERYGAEISEQSLETAQKARFSRHTVSPEELAAMRREAEKTAAAVWNGASKSSRFVIRYVFNLY
ncbi:MAG: hypothetical protein GX424_08185 [Clostridiales bacterium]|nr:hypothetical protein [Clostridiales bacterium]